MGCQNHDLSLIFFRNQSKRLLSTRPEPPSAIIQTAALIFDISISYFYTRLIYIKEIKFSLYGEIMWLNKCFLSIML